MEVILLPQIVVVFFDREELLHKFPVRYIIYSNIHIQLFTFLTMVWQAKGNNVLIHTERDITSTQMRSKVYKSSVIDVYMTAFATST